MISIRLRKMHGIKYVRFAISVLALCASNITSAQELYNAAEQGQINKIKSLYSQGADLNSRNDFDMTALHFAAYEGHEKVVAFLLAHGAQIDAQNKNGYTPLMLAIDGKHVNVARALISAGANINLHADTMDRHVDLDGKPFACIKRATALSEAWNKHDANLVKWLLSIGANPNVELEPVKGGIRCQGSGETLFHKVVDSKNYDMIKLFLEHGAKVSKKQHILDPFSGRSSWIGPSQMSRGDKKIRDLLRSYEAKQAHESDH